MTIDREKLIQAALAGFSATKEGFNGECWFPHLVPDEAEMQASLAAAQGERGRVVRAAVELALQSAGILTDVDVDAANAVINEEMK